MTKPISVLIACYNAEQYIEQAIDSLLAQTRLADEVIVVDDGSTDGSVAKIKRYADGGVQLIQQANRGASDARNRAFAASTGQFVVFVDADDVVGPRHLESLLARLSNNPRRVAFSKWDRFYHTPEEALFPDRPTERDMPGIDWLMLDWKDGRSMMQSGMILIPRFLIEEHGGWNEDLSLFDDFEFFARIISKSEGMLFAPDARLFYRSGRAGTLSGQKSRKAIESAFKSIMLSVSHVLAVEDTASTRQICANILMDFQYAHYPDYPSLRAEVLAKVTALGGATRGPDGPPGFHRLRPVTGWKIARRVQRMAERHGLNKAGQREE